MRDPTPDPTRAIELRIDHVVATVHPDVGGRLGQICVGDDALLAGYEPGHPWHRWGSYPLLPWSNRIARGTFTWDGREWTMPERFEDGTALHGLVHSTPWDVAEATTTAVTMTTRIDTEPWTLDSRQSIELTEAGLTQSVTLTNVSSRTVPVGLGIHPWFRAGLVRVPADLIWPAVGCLPTGPPRPVDPRTDLRCGTIPPHLDDCYTGLTDTTADIGRVQLSWSGPVTQVVVYTGTPGWACVEPVTNVNDGFNLLARGMVETGVLVLEPGTSTRCRYRFAWPTHRRG